MRTYWHVAHPLDRESIAQQGLFARNPRTGQSGAEQINNPGGAAIYLWDKFPSRTHRYHGIGDIWAIEADAGQVQIDTMIHGARYLPVEHVQADNLRFVGEMGRDPLTAMPGLSSAEIDRPRLGREFFSQGGASAWAQALHQLRPDLHLSVLHGWELDYEQLVPLAQVCVDAQGSVITPVGRQSVSEAAAEIASSPFLYAQEAELHDQAQSWEHGGYYGDHAAVDERLLAIAQTALAHTLPPILPPLQAPSIVQSQSPPSDLTI